MLTDDQVLEIFKSPDVPPDWIETMDVENQEYEFCDLRGQSYVGVITEKIGWISSGKFELHPKDVPDIQNALRLVDRAVSLRSNQFFVDLEALRSYLIKQQGTKV